MRGKGCGSRVRAFGQVERVLSGFIFVINGADRFGFIFVHDVDLWPVVSSLRISTRFVFLHPLPAFFLPVALDFAEVAVLAVSIVVVATSGVAGTSA